MTASRLQVTVHLAERKEMEMHAWLSKRAPRIAGGVHVGCVRIIREKLDVAETANGKCIAQMLNGRDLELGNHVLQ